MKKLLVCTLAGLFTLTLITGCETHLGGGSSTRIEQPTIGQQLIDLQRAKEAGAITDSEYQAEKSKLLQSK